MNGPLQLLPPDDAEISQIIRLPALDRDCTSDKTLPRRLSLDEGRRAAAVTGARASAVVPARSALAAPEATGELSFAACEELGRLESNREQRRSCWECSRRRSKELVPLLRALVTVRATAARAAALSLFPAARRGGDRCVSRSARLLVSDASGRRNCLRMRRSDPLAAGTRPGRADSRDQVRGRLEGSGTWRVAETRRKRGRVGRPDAGEARRFWPAGA